MTKYLIVLLLIVGMVGCVSKDYKQEYIPVNAKISDIKNNEFHIKVKPYMSDCTYWQVIFTNDNFRSEENIMEVFDLSQTMNTEYVVFQKELLETEQEAVSLAKLFASYKNCVEYNYNISRQYDSILSYRKLHPVRISYTDPYGNKTESCDPNTEIIIR